MAARSFGKTEEQLYLCFYLTQRLAFGVKNICFQGELIIIRLYVPKYLKPLNNITIINFLIKSKWLPVPLEQYKKKNYVFAENVAHVRIYM